MARFRCYWLALVPALFVVMQACGGGSSLSSRSTQQVPGSGSVGSAWSKVSTPAGAGSITFFAVNGSNHWFIADRLTGFYRSTDQGATWTQINSGIQYPFGWTIQVDPANGDLIANTCSCSAPNLNPVGFFRSSDEGNTWTQIPNPSGFHLSLNGAQTGCAFTANSNMICGGYYGQGIAWVSTNGGQSTTTVTSSPLLGTAFSIAFNSVKNDVWLGTEQRGVYHSTNNGTSWVQVSPNAVSLDPVNGVMIGNVYGLNFDRNGDVLASSQGGVWKSSPSGSGFTWNLVLKNQNTSAGKGIGRDSAGNLYYGHNSDSLNPITIYRSTDNGASWSEFDNGIPQQYLQGRNFTYNHSDGQMYVVIFDEATGHGWLYRTG